MSLPSTVFQYLFPLVIMEETRLRQSRAFNIWQHSRAYPPGNFKLIIRPNFDTLYSAAWLDLTNGPIVIDVPDTNGRYYCMHMMDMWTDSFAVPGSRTWGTNANSCTVVGPNTSLSDPSVANCPNVIQSPTPYVWIINRIKTDGVADYEEVHKLQNKFHIRKFQSNESARVAVPKMDKALRKIPPLKVVRNMNARTFFNKAAQLLAFHPPRRTDGSIVLEMQRLGFIQGQPFNFDTLPLTTQTALESGMREGWKGMRESLSTASSNTANGWDMVTDLGIYGNNYNRRAGVAAGGLGAVPPRDAIYSTLSTTLPCDGMYTMTFKPDDMPPCDAFWSITLYDSKGYPVENKWNKYALNNKHGLVLEDNGSLILHIQQESPGKEREKNWLPSPKTGNISLSGRFYAPREDLLNMKWKSPPVVRIDVGSGGVSAKL